MALHQSNPATDPEGESMRWMEAEAAKHHHPYRADDGPGPQVTADELIQAGYDYINDGDYFTQHGDESLRDELDRHDYWYHWQRITGVIVRPETTDELPFTCSC